MTRAETRDDNKIADLTNKLVIALRMLSDIERGRTFPAAQWHEHMIFLRASLGPIGLEASKKPINGRDAIT